MKMWKLYLLACAAGVGVGPIATHAAQGDAEAASRLREEITAVIGEAKCRNLVNCRIVGLGVRPCGGPEEYVAYSIWNTEREEISVLVSEYNLLKEDMMLDSDAVGSCEMLPKPDVNCVRGHCVIVPGTN
jgi:hypothetical protein